MGRVDIIAAGSRLSPGAMGSGCPCHSDDHFVTGRTVIPDVPSLRRVRSGRSIYLDV